MSCVDWVERPTGLRVAEAAGRSFRKVLLQESVVWVD